MFGATGSVCSCLRQEVFGQMGDQTTLKKTDLKEVKSVYKSPVDYLCILILHQDQDFHQSPALSHTLL